MKHNEPFEDDGRTVADMSGIEHDSIWLPRRRKQGHTPAQQPQQAADRPWEEDPQLTGKERLWAILGALKATLLICGVYLLCFPSGIKKYPRLCFGCVTAGIRTGCFVLWGKGNLPGFVGDDACIVPRMSLCGEFC